MTSLPRLDVNDLPATNNDDLSATASPARGREMRQNLLSKLRAPPLVHAWDFWHDRQDRKPPSSTTAKPDGPTSSETKYEDRLLHLSSITDVKAFWSTFNNFDITALPLRDSVHLFHRGVKPVWEDPRNTRGGSWTFRVPKDKAPEFWKEVCMMAIGEQLQAAVESKRITFRDDICGVSLSVRFNSILVQVWHRDADHEEGRERIVKTVLEGLSEELKPREGSWYYKRHDEHGGFEGAR
ncbi:Eukaryotic translation initiation factor 4E type 3-A [Sphaceloma murrayae]|uniref:Eukaryotic translation initiation factor 4E type 3-A n=1 Tax=Sphaceloma murrayae TaxID=2082308 RepID=A0A2K1QW19_9PEZI|nr:Eukaryotic translation initiation factor 4E type 3-A [Sphaceloma murrayae]